MASSTTNYNLIKPDYEDNADIKDLNDNFDTIDMAMNNKVDKEVGKGLSTNDYTTAEKTKLDNLAEIKTVGTGLNLDDNGELTATGGGSGGTTNYNDLSNKPQINGNTLSGNKTSAQLGLASASDIPTTLADLSGDSTHRTVSDTEKAAWNNKSDFSGSYNDLTNKPTIPDELSDLTEDATHRTVTDTEKSTWNGKQSALSSAQLDAVNSGIDSTKVAQIATNENNILTDEAALIELVDGGAKNFLQNIAASQTISGVKFTVNADKSVTVSGTATSNITSFFINREVPVLTENMVLSGCPEGGSANTYKLDILDGTPNGPVLFEDFGEGTNVDWNLFTRGMYTARIRIGAGTTVNGLIFKPMLCTKAAWRISPSYQPRRPSYQELVERTTIYMVESSLFSYVDTLSEGIYFARQSTATGTDKPVSNKRYMYQIFVYSSSYATITAYEGQSASAPIMYIVNKENGTWGSWYKFEGTEVT